ncbi:MAG: hypothetical protein IKG15_09550 [Solobacterium sp.]|nr:hypothetical protein [Solobacterium sp.]
MSKIRYCKIADSLCNEAFAQVTELLFDGFGYRVMTPAEFRKVDLKEKLLAFEKEHTHIDKKKKTDTSDFAYANDIGFYLKHYVKCTPESQAAKYKERALDIIRSVKESGSSTEDLVDLTIIFICLMREAFPSIEKDKETEISDLDFVLKKEDAELLKKMKDFSFRVPQGIVEKGIIHIVPKQIKQGTEDKLTRFKSEESKYATYLISSLLYCSAMQAQGEYAKESGAENE